MNYHKDNSISKNNLLKDEDVSIGPNFFYKVDNKKENIKIELPEFKLQVEPLKSYSNKHLCCGCLICWRPIIGYKENTTKNSFYNKQYSYKNDTKWYDEERQEPNILARIYGLEFIWDYLWEHYKLLYPKFEHYNWEIKDLNRRFKLFTEQVEDYLKKIPKYQPPPTPKEKIVIINQPNIQSVPPPVPEPIVKTTFYHPEEQKDKSLDFIDGYEDLINIKTRNKSMKPKIGKKKFKKFEKPKKKRKGRIEIIKHTLPRGLMNPEMKTRKVAYQPMQFNPQHRFVEDDYI